MGLSLEIGMKQKQSLCLHQIQSLSILEMSAEELDNTLYQEFLENPLLEYEEGRARERSAASSGSGTYKSQGIKEISTDIPAENPDDWRSDLGEQIVDHKYSAEELRIIEFMIDMVDEDGIYRMSLEETASELECPLELVENCHLVLQGLEPYGVFSLSVESYLMKQLEQIHVKDTNLEYMVHNCLEDIGKGYLSSISRKLHISTLEVKKYIERIKALQPSPLRGVGENRKSYQVPDIILTKTNAGWEVYLNDEWIQNYSMNDYYLRMMEEAQDEELSAYFKRAKDRYQSVMSGIEQRRDTMLAIGRAVLEYQEAFFQGAGGKNPMTMSDVAERIGLHVSTVSRAVKGKYLQAPQIGTVEIRSLFSASSYQKDGKNMDVGFVKQVIKGLIEKEETSSPYSDSKIVQLLQKQDIHVARRTVAKYREELNIPKLSERRIG